MKKRCGRCKKEKSLTAFSKLKTGKIPSYCRSCANAYRNEYYKNNIRSYKERNKKNRLAGIARSKEVGRKAKAVPCADCGEKFPFFVMQFDHLHGKERNVSEMMAGGFSEKRILQEIAKCEVICANCHAIRTYFRAWLNRLREGKIDLGR